VPRRWRFAEEHAREIAAHFAERRRNSSYLWNGRLLLMSDYAIDGGVLRGRFFETDYANFIAWRDWDFPDPSVTNCFAMGAVRSSDGAFLLGVMAAGTANAGRIYFPAGTPEPADVRDDTVDLAGNIVRELAEETGLTPADYTPVARWHAIATGPRLALIRVLQAAVPADRLRRSIMDHIGREAKPELADIRIVRGPADFDPMMPDFVTAFLRQVWG